MATVFMQRVTWRAWGFIASETALISGAVAAAAYLHLPNSAATVDDLLKALFVAVLCQVCLYYAELYEFRVLSNRRELVARLLQSLGAASVLLAAIYFWFPALVLGHGVFVIASVLVIVGAIAWRLVFGWASARIGHRERLLLVGASPATISLARELAGRTDLGVDIVGFVDPKPAPNENGCADVPALGSLDDIPSIVERRGVDRVVVSLADARGRLPMETLLKMKLDRGVRFDDLPSVYEEYTGKIAVENLRPSWLIFSRGFRTTRMLKVVKRTFDALTATIGLILAAPVMGLVAISIKLTSPGPVFYHQRRVGQHGRVFALHKFRSMCVEAEAQTGAVWATEDDSRVTPNGRILRRLRLDELPQLWNVLQGEMSLVGPRPERPEFVGDLTRQIQFYPQRHVVKPGVTGWAQVKYRYGASVEEAMEKLQFDLFYIKNMSLRLDLFIILKTIQTVVLQRGT